MKTYISYYRVSTKRQGASGLGLEGQVASVEKFVANRGVIVNSYTEVESGKNNNRTQLAAAIAEAKKLGATLIIAKLDRLSRNVSFIASLMDSRVDFIACDMPDATPLTIHIFAAIAQHERETIVARIKTALDAKKARGEKLGNDDNLTLEGRTTGRAIMQQNAKDNENNIKAMQLIKLLRKDNLSYQAIAIKLNDTGYRTRRGLMFSAMQVQRLATQTI